MTEPPLPDALRERILVSARITPAPARRELRRRSAILVSTAFVVLFGVFFAFGGTRTGPRPASLIIGTAVGLSLIATLAAWVAIGRGRSMVGRPRGWLTALIVATPAALFAWKVIWSARYPHMMDAWQGRIGLRCLRLTLLMAAWPLVAVAVTRAKSDPIHPRTSGMAMGIAVGACAGVLTDLWCPVAYIPHLLLGHVLPLVLVGLAGLWVGHRFLTVRAPR